MRTTLSLFSILAFSSVAASAQEDFSGNPREIKAGTGIRYQVWISKPGKVHVRWTGAANDPKAHRFHGRIESEQLWEEVERVQAGEPGTAVQLAGGRGEIRWDTETGKWLDGFDGVCPPNSKMLRFTFWVDGKRVNPALIQIGGAGKPAKQPVIYWAHDPPSQKWPAAEGIPTLRKTPVPSYWIGVDTDGYIYVYMLTKNADPPPRDVMTIIRAAAPPAAAAPPPPLAAAGAAVPPPATAFPETKFSGNIVARGGRIDLVSGLQDGDPRVKAGTDERVEFEYGVAFGMQGFRFRPNPHVRTVEFDLAIDGKDVTNAQLFLGKDGKPPMKASPFSLSR